MAAKPSTAAEKALQKIQDQVTCGICLEPYKQPKRLKCFHVFCEQCLQPLVRVRRRRQSLKCPQCRQDTLLPVGGVSELQGAFYLLQIQESLKEANLSNRCSKHPEKEAEFYCDPCNQLICSYCLVSGHRAHQYDLVPEAFAKQEIEIVESLEPVEEQIAVLERAIESVDVRCTSIVEQKMAIKEKIHAVMADLRDALEARETELIDQADQTVQTKLCKLTAQREKIELQLGQLRSCQHFVEESQRNHSQGEILMMKSPLMKKINDLTGSFKPETLAVAEEADMRFSCWLPELVKTCQQFGTVYCHAVCPEKCRASGEGIKVAMRGQTAAVSVEALDSEGEACLRPVDSLRCELVASDGSSRVRGTVNRRNQNIYDISYQPQVTGEHQLHILIGEHHILNSPLTVTVLPNFTAPASIIGDLKGPWGIAVREGGEVVVAEHDGDCISIINTSGEKKSFGTYGSESGQFKSPKGLAIDAGGHVVVSDDWNDRTELLSESGHHLKTFGKKGREPQNLRFPRGVAVHPNTQKVYIVDNGNCRIQVLNPDFSYCNSFGTEGSNTGEFNEPYDLATDSIGNVYVAERKNHRIQVFTVGGMYLRQFGGEGEGGGKLKEPVSIAIDSRGVVYVGERGNDRVSIFSTNGKFITSFGCQGKDPAQFNGPFGLAVDKKGTLYVADTDNGRIQIFT